MTKQLEKEIHIKKIKQILIGIERDECEDDRGWWETAESAQFGKKKLQELLDYIIPYLSLPQEPTQEREDTLADDLQDQIREHYEGETKKKKGKIIPLEDIYFSDLIEKIAYRDKINELVEAVNSLIDKQNHLDSKKT